MVSVNQVAVFPMPAELLSAEDCRKVGELIADIARAKAPVRTGRLRDSIRVESYSKAGAVVGSTLPYAATREHARHYMDMTPADQARVDTYVAELAAAHIRTAPMDRIA